MLNFCFLLSLMSVFTVSLFSPLHNIWYILRQNIITNAQVSIYKYPSRFLCIFQFNFCLKIWTLHNRTWNKRINNLHKRAVRQKYKDKQSLFKEFLEIDHTKTVHHKNVQVWATEIFKVKNQIVSEIMRDVFGLKEYHVSYSRNWIIARTNM